MTNTTAPVANEETPVIEMTTSPEIEAPETENPESEEELNLPLTAAQERDRAKSIRNYYKEQIEKLKPQVEMAELRARLQKAAFESYYFASKTDEFEAMLAKQDEQKIAPVTDSEEKGGDDASK